MKTLISAIAVALLASTAQAKTTWNSVYTNLTKDCIVVSQSTDKADIDFADSECKSFGGYTLNIEGGDLRYGPLLSYAGQVLDIERPGAFHDMASDNVEWIYSSTIDEEGSGTVRWAGLIYRLVVDDQDPNKPDSKPLYVVRLDGAKTCLLGTTLSNDEARKMVYNSKAVCK